MSNNLNQCTFIGNLNKTPEMRFMTSGEAVASFSIGVGSSWKDKQGVKQEAVEWVNCTVFGKLTEICEKFLQKGSKVYISGRMKTEKYTDNNGVEKYSTKIIVQNMEMLDRKPRSEDQSKPPQQPQQRTQQADAYRNQSGGQAARPAPNFDDEFDSIPF